MHLKSYPKVLRSELRLDASGVQTSQCSGVFVSQQGALLRTCSSYHGNISSSRLPLSVLSTNTLRCSNATNNTLRLYQTTAEDGDTPLDIWTVIKPGHVREKIAIFASEAEHTDGTRGSERTSSSGSDGRDWTPAACTSVNSGMPGLFRAVKAKGSWEESCSAKRRRRSGNVQKLQQDTQQHSHKLSPRHLDGDKAVMAAAEEEEQKVSVVEMVAFLEQRTSEQQPDTKHLLALQRSSTTITLSRALPPELREGSEVRGEEPESVRVLDMVAKLESECLRRRTEGDLSRSNSLRRVVGRVLLAAGDQSSAPCQPSSASSVTSSSSLPGAQSVNRETPGAVATALATPPSGKEAAVEAMGAGSLSTAPEAQTEVPPPQMEEAEPPPGLLFLSLPPASGPRPHTGSEPRPPHNRTTFELEPAPSQSRPLTACCDSGSQSEKIGSDIGKRRSDTAQEEEEVGDETPCSAVVPLGRRASVSQDFLLMRQRLQQLLEPQPYLAVLPHHLLLKIFLLLPTQSLAALKCSCHYFKFIIDNYGVRPADSLWVSDPRYHDDPCKQCKKRYGRGDVSLCRWHHKPYCQALPYGPGYWMCCHGAHRDAPGCNVGLHDNRWVPAFHSINVPIYRRSRHDD